MQPGHKARLLLKPQIGWEDALKEASAHFMRLASASSVEFLKEGQTPEGKLVSAVTGGAELFIPLGDLVDLDKEAQRLQKEYDNLTGEIARAQGRLNNPGFLSKAPEALVLQDKQKLEDNIAMQQTLKQRLSDLRN
ncbi:Valine--tRNA ligase [bioreactor metagenome]|uniref:valine--tRNA ligase n=1 Tax=bioreactor metagenome TaxID=1076179 RepID=A0A645H651_9ZZZZ